MMTPHNVNPAQWQQNVGYARTACARIFRDGGRPADALAAFGLAASGMPAEWNTVVDRIAGALSHTSMRKAA